MFVESSSYHPSVPHQSIGVAIFNEIKKKNPGTVALVDGETGKDITYKMLSELSVNLAIRLQEMGLKENSTIAIISENSWKYSIAAISSWYIGAKVLLLNPDYLTDELRHFLDICPSDLMFCSKKSLTYILTLGDEVSSLEKLVLFDGKQDEIKNFDSLITYQKCDNFQPVEVNLEETAIILSSSGTTGFPKCVPLSHGNMIVEINAFGHPKFFTNGPNEVTLGYLPIFHVFGIFVLLTSIIYQIKIVIIPKFKSDLVLRKISEYKVTRLFAVPTVLLFLVKNFFLEKYDLSSVKDIIAGGAAITADLEHMVKEKLNIRVRQVYGMTETTCCMTIVPKELPRGRDKSGSVGTVLPTYKVKVTCPATENNLGPNQIGEIRVTGPSIIKGYLNNEQATRAAFDDDGFLKTGDVGYFDDDHFLYVVGRSKEIIKYKSFQVSPSELEHLILKHSSVKNVGVVGKPDEAAGEVPVAFVEKQPGCDVTEQELVDFVRKRVSVQKQLHGGVIFIGEIPKTPSGKICRHKLKDLL